MLRLQQFALWALGAVALGACSHQAGVPETAPIVQDEGQQSFPHAMSAAEKAACASSGGTVQRRGRIQAESCARSFVDAGKVCTDSAQCQGKCLGEVADTAATSQVSGQCQAHDQLFGCYSAIKGGKGINAICVD